MEEKQLLETAEIDENDWEQTPVSVRNLVVKLFDKIEQLEKHLKELQETNEKISEKVNQNSQNSNNPPTSEPLNVEIPKKKRNWVEKREEGK
jgi:transposase